MLSQQAAGSSRQQACSVNRQQAVAGSRHAQSTGSGRHTQSMHWTQAAAGRVAGKQAGSGSR